MKKTLTLILALCLILSMAIVPGASAEKLADFVDYRVQSSELETWCIQHSQSSMDLDVLCNCIDGLLTNDKSGALIGQIAKEWSSNEDGTVWTFKLRDDVKWVDNEGEEMADCVAEDFLWGLEFVLNYAKNEAANTSMPIEMIKGAGDYYEYTKALAESDNQAALDLDLEKFKEMVGIEMPDDYTVVYTLSGPYSYFPTVATYSCLSPISSALLEELGADGYRNVTFDTLWYNGPYYVSEFVDRSYKILVANPLYYNKDVDEVFDSVKVQMVESGDQAFLLYEAGEIDRVDLTQANLTAIYNNPDDKFYDYLVEKRPTKYSYDIHFNYNKLFEDGTEDAAWNAAVANENFRLAWYYGIDLTDYFGRTNFINPLSCQNFCYTASGLCVTSDGRDYTQLVLDELGMAYDPETYTRYDADKAAEYVAKAKEELTAAGVELPVKAAYFVLAGNQTQLDTAEVLKQSIEANLGDIVELEIGTYVASLKKEIVAPHLQSFVINGWGADFGDPVNFVGQETYGEDNAYYSKTYSFINDATDEALIATYQEFTAMVNEAKAINGDLDARYAAFAKAEAFLIQHALSIPCYLNVGWELTKINPYSQIYCAYGMMNYRYVNYDSNSDGYTTAEAAELKAAYEAN